MPNRPYRLATATAVSMAVAAVIMNPGHRYAAPTTSTPIRDANVPAPQLALPFYPRCQEQPFDTGQFHALAPASANRSSVLAVGFHTLAICDNGSITINSIGTP